MAAFWAEVMFCDVVESVDGIVLLGGDCGAVALVDGFVCDVEGSEGDCWANVTAEATERAMQAARAMGRTRVMGFSR
jgi:hypothetical protein